jgi:poly(3-hydroxybutyrate) depolymerase
LVASDQGMYPMTQFQATFESGGKDIRLDCFLPIGNGQQFPAVIGLHGSGADMPV